MSAGHRSFFAFWMGGAGAAPVTTSAGARSMLAPWMGGAGAPQVATTAGGYRSLMAFWMGGASGESGQTQPTTSPKPISSAMRSNGWGSHVSWNVNRNFVKERNLMPDKGQNAARRRQIDEDDDIMLRIIIQAVTRGLL